MSDPTPPFFSRWRLGASFVAAWAVAMVLHTLGQLLEVPAGFGVEDFLGWADAERSAQILALWAGHLRGAAAAVEGLYLGLDTALFIPLYGLVFTALWWQAQRDLAEHLGKPPTWGQSFVRVGAAWVLALWCVDGVENTVGLLRMGLPGVVPVAWLGLLAAVWLLGRLCDPAWLDGLLRATGLRGTSWRERLLVQLPAWLGALLLVAWSVRGTACGADAWVKAGCLAHAMKQPLIVLLLAAPLLPLLWAQFGPHTERASWPRLVAVRAALVGMLWRTRYVLAALAACAGLLLALNQGRDVLYAMASHPWDDAAQGTAALVGAGVALGLAALALWVLGYSCWLWARLALRVARRGQGLPSGPPRLEDHLARLWARLLGLMPALLTLAMVQAVLPQAVVLDNKGPIVVLLAFAVVVLLGSVAFIWQRDREARRDAATAHYYASATLGGALDWARGRRLFGFVPHLALPAFALALSLAGRALSVYAPEAPLPTLTLPIVLTLVAFWLGVAGWISLYEESEAVPWFLIGLVVVGALGLAGWTENHQAPIELAGATVAAGQAFHFTLALGALWGLVSLGLAWRLSKPAPSVGWVVFFAIVLVGGSLLVLRRADARLPRPDPADAQPQAMLTAPDAVGTWLSQFKPDDGSPAPLPLYVLTAEGGGIRNAYWTALVLAKLHEASTGEFDRRALAMIGVSGGSVGLAVYRACRLAWPDSQAKLEACIDRFGRADLLSPLVSAWFFEDAIARWIPVKGCRQPGCGFMSRGLWFEGAMVAATPALQTGLAASRETLLAASHEAHQPYLLLNSTWVESGERTVASELLIDWHHFPGARDQLALLGRDLPLVSASHNSARFPYTNALGAVHPANNRCSPEAYAQRGSADTAGAEACGHLADGGYFDNSGSHTAADLLGLVQRCLNDKSPQASAFCPTLDPAQRQRLAGRVQLKHLLVRNGVGLGPMPVGGCREAKGVPSQVRLSGEPQPQDPLGLAQPLCAPNGKLFIDLLGVPWTAVNTTGIGANGRLAAARPSEWGDATPGLADLREDGPLYPLGWHLSAAARQAMKKQAKLLDTDRLLKPESL